MTNHEKVKQLVRSDFLDEIHHLLWVEPYENQGRWDEGWNCRNHALIAGAVACLFKLKGSIIYGKSTFVQGSDGELPPIGIAADPHAWFGLDGLGYFDLSPRLTRCKDPEWRSWSLKGIALSRCFPEGEFALTISEQEYENRVNEATHVPQIRRAVYLGRTAAHFSRKLLVDAFAAADSPLTVKLSQKYEPGIFAKASIHLFKFLKGESQSLCHLSPDSAWDAINSQPGDGIDWVCYRAGLQ